MARKARWRTVNGRFAKPHAPGARLVRPPRKHKRRSRSFVERLRKAILETEIVEEVSIDTKRVEDQYKQGTFVLNIHWDDPLGQDDAGELLYAVEPVILSKFKKGKAIIGVFLYQEDAAGDITSIGEKTTMRFMNIREAFETAKEDMATEAYSKHGFFQGGYRADYVGGLLFWIQ